MLRFTPCALVVVVVSSGLAAVSLSAAEPTLRLDEKLHHLRAEGPREWTEFPERAESDRLEVRFDAAANKREWTLELRQQDLKQDWSVTLNGKSLGKLVRDENDMRIYLPVPPGTVVDGANVLRVEQGGRAGAIDDIRVGELALHKTDVDDLLDDASITVTVLDAETDTPLPCRLTIVDARGALQSVLARDSEQLAVRPGVVYTGTGQVTLGLPAGKYTVYAGRGFEYSLASKPIELSSSQQARLNLSIRREVPTGGYVACDTHIHTLTHSGHGDASADERMITLAGEGIELPIATDHNVQIDQRPFAEKLHVRKYFTPVVGNEVTTRTGHFNIFPAPAGGPVPDTRLSDWKEIFDEIERTTGAKAIILNHARDLHGGTRPFGPGLHNAVVGENLDGWHWGANAMEVINSGATQTDATQLLHDWMGMLNRGRFITPVGSSDSHDVARHFVGQGRTYIRCDDHDPGNIDVDEAVNSFVAGRVLVSYGLLAEIEVNGRYRSGDLAPAADEYIVSVRVLGPHWTSASDVELFADGERIAHWSVPEKTDAKLPRGVKWRGETVVKRPLHDRFLTVIATGPGIDGLYWKTAKAYQPTSPDWTPHVLACSGAVWLDADGDGKRSSAYDYARRAFDAADGDLAKLVASIADSDRAVAAQAAHLVQSSGTSLFSEEAQAVWRKCSPAVQAGFREYLEAWRECERARAAR